MNRKNVKPVVAITMGDFNGIGPEIILRSVLSGSVRKICVPVVIGSVDVLEYYARRSGTQVTIREISSIPAASRPGVIPVFNLRKYHRPAVRPGALSREAGEFTGDAIEVAAGLCLQHLTDAMVTAPASKEALHRAGFHFPGQTEMLASLCGMRDATMMLVAGKMRVALATVHVPLRRVTGEMSTKLYSEKLAAMHGSLRIDFAIRRPSIAVLGVNPHAGENGELGNEEKERIMPAIRRACARGWKIRGPFPADGFFGTGADKVFDAILAAYHDQGLIPLKMTGFETGVNYSAGLPIVRTSPDHGTAFDIAGKGIASPRSMIEAIRLAVAITENRRRHRR